MKIALVFLGCVALAVASVVPPMAHKVADKDLLTKQKFVVDLLWGVTQPVYVPELYEVAKNYHIEEHLSQYTNPEAVKYFLTLYKYGTLPKEEVFTVFNERHFKEATALFNVFFYAKDFDTFFKTACWARVYFNPGQFVYAFTTAVAHREDFKGVVFPAPYEIYPHLFVTSDVVQKAYHSKFAKSSPNSEGEYEPVFLTINNTGLYPYYQYTTDKYPVGSWMYNNFYDYNVNVHPEHRVSYFTEDVALNTYHYFFHVFNPFFLNSTYGYKTEGRGELYFYYYQQLFARYVLERISNDLLDLETVTLQSPIEYGYNPNLRYPNGKAFPVRSDKFNVQEHATYEFKLVEDFEKRITEAIDFGYVYTTAGEKVSLYNPAGIDILGKMIFSTVNSVNPSYYGKLYQLVLNVFGHIVDTHYNHDVAPGVLEHFETALRDPLYYRILAYFTQFYHRYKATYGPYHYEDFAFPGVKVTSVEMDKLITYFDKFEFDVSSLVATGKINQDLVIKAKQYRLNHKPFTYKIYANTGKATTAMVRVFIGPKYDVEGHVFDINDKRKFMVEIDRFPYELTAGENVITRNSHDIFSTTGDYTSVRDLYRNVVNAMEGKTEFHVSTGYNSQCAFPNRFLLPKGKRGGLPLTFFVAITPFTGDSTTTTTTTTTTECGTGLGLFPQDKYPMGYPFDRPIDVTQFYVPNFYEKEVVVFHKKTEETMNNSI